MNQCAQPHTVHKCLCTPDTTEPTALLPVPLVERQINGKPCVVVTDHGPGACSFIPEPLHLGDVILTVGSLTVKTLDVRACAYVRGTYGRCIGIGECLYGAAVNPTPIRSQKVPLWSITNKKSTLHRTVGRGYCMRGARTGY